MEKKQPRKTDDATQAIIEKAQTLVDRGKGYGDDLTKIIDLVISPDFIECRGLIHTVNTNTPLYRAMSKLIKKALYALFDLETGFVLTMDSLKTIECLPEQYAFNKGGTGIMLHDAPGVIYYSQILSVRSVGDSSVYATMKDIEPVGTSLNDAVDTLVQKKYY